MRKNYVFLSLFFTFLFIGIFLSCTKERGVLPGVVKVVDCSTVTFSKDIKPIIDQQCVSCHSGGSEHGDLEDYSDVKVKADNGSLNQRVVIDKTMPQDNRLTDEQVQKFKCWIENGAKND